jgi:DNA helicase-2/ATP-dependent DNA helicase PcrA
VDDRNSILLFLDKIDSYISLHKSSVLEGVKDFIDSSALYSVDILKEDVHLESDSVKLMTLHASKGLEFQHVFIVGANFGLIPLMSKTAEEREEELRLFFVGVTRAKDFLELSYCTSPDDSRAFPGPSNYLAMISPNVVHPDDAAERKADLQAYRREAAASKNSLPPAALKNPKPHKVSHPKYGIGIVKKEDSDNITVEFAGHGIKEFIKELSNLTDA